MDVSIPSAIELDMFKNGFVEIVMVLKYKGLVEESVAIISSEKSWSSEFLGQIVPFW